jgi:hypothetical protein
MYVKIVARQDDETIICLVRWVDRQTNEWLTFHVLAEATPDEAGPIPHWGDRDAAIGMALSEAVELRAIVAAEKLVRRFELSSSATDRCKA